MITKDKAFQPSSPIRHATELQCVIAEKFGDTCPPDHRLTFGSVQVSIVCLFLRLNLDMVVAVRCAPHQSWTNLAERCMSILNLALQNVALQRDLMSEELEKYVSNVSTLSELRSLASSKPEFKTAYLRSMQPCCVHCESSDDLVDDREVKHKDNIIQSDLSVVNARVKAKL